MPLEIHLLGRPRVGGREGAQPRGRKAWGLLALLVLSQRAVTREYAAAMLFPAAEDPRAALRWNLAQLRAALGDEVIPEGRLELVLPPRAFLDVHALAAGDWREAIAVPGCGHELLEGFAFPGCASFEAWLLAERRHLVGLAEQALREAALYRLAEGEPDEATALAARLVELNPYEETFQELLVRAYTESGDRDAARRQTRAASELFRQELGRELPEAIVRAATASGGATGPRPGRAAISAQFEAGLAAVRAGAVDTGLEILRAAAAAAHSTGDSELEARALAAVGSALVHAARGRDEEGSLALHRARVVAERSEHRAVAAIAYSELGYIEVLRARYARAAFWLARAAEYACDDDHALAAVHRNRGMALSDIASYGPALAALDQSLRHARRAGDHREECFAMSLVGRVHTLRGEIGRARATLERSLALAEQAEWTTFHSWPEALLAGAELADGEYKSAAKRFEHAFALGCQLEDPCWEALGQRGLGLVAAATGDSLMALELLVEARQRALREPDAYLWVAVYVLDALCETAVASGSDGAEAWIAELRGQAARTGMRELLVRSHLHDGHRGLRQAFVVGHMLAAEVDNPALVSAFA